MNKVKLLMLAFLMRSETFLLKKVKGLLLSASSVSFSSQP